MSEFGEITLTTRVTSCPSISVHPRMDLESDHTSQTLKILVVPLQVTNQSLSTIFLIPKPVRSNTIEMIYLSRKDSVV